MVDSRSPRGDDQSSAQPPKVARRIPNRRVAGSTGSGARRSARSRAIRSARGISTGQASVHAPHRLDALGRSRPESPALSSGVSTAPIGPGYTESYA